MDECWISMKISTHRTWIRCNMIWRYHLWLSCNCLCKEFVKSCSIPFFHELLYFRCNQKALLQAAYANAFNPYGSQRTSALVRNWSYQICFIIIKCVILLMFETNDQEYILPCWSFVYISSLLKISFTLSQIWDKSMCTAVIGNLHWLSLFSAIDQKTVPEELPVSGDPYNETMLELLFPLKEVPLFKLNGKKLQLLKPLDRDDENLSHVVFQVRNFISQDYKNLPDLFNF